MTPQPRPSSGRARNLFYRWLTYLVLAPLIVSATVFFGSVALLCGLWDKHGRQQHAIARLWARTLLRLSLSPVRVEGAERLRPREAAVYASNHLSYYDTPLLFGRLPFQFRILAKQPLWKVPFIGWYLNRSGQVPVDHASTRRIIASLQRGVETLREGIALVIFPEGGRSADGTTQPFVAGAAWIAIKAQAPLVPVTIVGTHELMPMHAWYLNPHRLKIILGEPISTAGLTIRDANALTERLHEIIAQTYSQQRQE